MCYFEWSMYISTIWTSRFSKIKCILSIFTHVWYQAIFRKHLDLVLVVPRSTNIGELKIIILNCCLIKLRLWSLLLVPPLSMFLGWFMGVMLNILILWSCLCFITRVTRWRVTSQIWHVAYVMINVSHLNNRFETTISLVLYYYTCIFTVAHVYSTVSHIIKLYITCD